LPIASSTKARRSPYRESIGGSTLAAAGSLQQLGLYRATDLAGGFAAWRAAGLPTMHSSATVHSETAAGDTP